MNCSNNSFNNCNRSCDSIDGCGGYDGCYDGGYDGCSNCCSCENNCLYTNTPDYNVDNCCNSNGYDDSFFSNSCNNSCDNSNQCGNNSCGCADNCGCSCHCDETPYCPGSCCLLMHNHEFIASTETNGTNSTLVPNETMSCNCNSCRPQHCAKHTHRIASITESETSTGASHTHKVNLTTTTVDGHYHSLCTKTGPAIILSNSKHIHIIEGVTTNSNNHTHTISASTLQAKLDTKL